MSIPPEVAADLKAPDGRRANHYALRSGRAAQTGARAGGEQKVLSKSGVRSPGTAEDGTGDGR